MTISKTKMRPMRLASAQKRDVRTQFAALCYRVQKDKVQVLLITSRGTGRWIIPKGWPMDGATPPEAALNEAWEEAGVHGKVMGNAMGIYSYNKTEEDLILPCVVAVFPVKTRKLAEKYPEMSQRRRKWVSLKKATGMLDDPELRQIVKHFNPNHL